MLIDAFYLQFFVKYCSIRLYFLIYFTVTQLEGQHPGTVGFSATRIALPGHVAQSQLGFSNSEITWYEFIL